MVCDDAWCLLHPPPTALLQLPQDSRHSSSDDRWSVGQRDRKLSLRVCQGWLYHFRCASYTFGGHNRRHDDETHLNDCHAQ